MVRAGVHCSITCIGKYPGRSAHKMCVLSRFYTYTHGHSGCAGSPSPPDSHPFQLPLQRASSHTQGWFDSLRPAGLPHGLSFKLTRPEMLLMFFRKEMQPSVPAQEARPSALSPPAHLLLSFQNHTDFIYWISSEVKQFFKSIDSSPLAAGRRGVM